MVIVLTLSSSSDLTTTIHVPRGVFMPERGSGENREEVLNTASSRRKVP